MANRFGFRVTRDWSLRAEITNDLLYNQREFMHEDLTQKRPPRGTQLPPPQSFREFRENCEEYFKVNGFEVRFQQGSVELRKGERIISQAAGFQELMLKLAFMQAMTIAERPA